MKKYIPSLKTNFILSLCLSTVLNAACNTQATNAANLSVVEFAQLNRHAEVKQVEEDEDFLSREEEEFLLNSDDEAFAEDEELLEREDIVMLLQGRNSDGDQVFTYLQLSINALREMKQAIINEEEFLPSDYGEVIYSGNGSPSQELREEMTERFGMMSAPTTPPPVESNYER